MALFHVINMRIAIYLVFFLVLAPCDLSLARQQYKQYEKQFSVLGFLHFGKKIGATIEMKKQRQHHLN